MKYLYSIPGMEDVEDVIISSGPNTWPNWRNFSDRIIQPGDIVFMDLAALTWNGPIQQISLARYLDHLGVNRNVAGERWTKIDIAQLEQAYHDGETS